MNNPMDQFTNLVFEGGGVKGIAYCGALNVLDSKGVLKNVSRVAGTSAGAITAGLLAVGYDKDEIFRLLKETSFSSFLDSHWGYIRDAIGLFSKFGWYKGKKFQQWFEELIEKKTGNRSFTFKDLKEKVANNDDGFKDLAVAGTNLTTQTTEIFSAETTPDVAIARAVRISMSIPLFFYVVNYNKYRYVDGGLYYNYPINIFDNAKYLTDKKYGIEIDYDPREGAVYNCQTLGLRVDTAEEIRAVFDKTPPAPIKSIKDYMKALISGYMEGMNKIHLHKNDWHRTIFIDSLGVKTTQFDLDDKTIEDLVESGKKGATKYLNWFENPGDADKPANKIS
jgi:NTE family protein